MNNNNYEFRPSSLEENCKFLAEYLKSLARPMDSYMEDNLDAAQISSIIVEGEHIGFVGLRGEALWFFYISKPFSRYAQSIFAAAIEDLSVKSVFFQTSDMLLVSLVTDWEFEKKKGAYFFQDVKRIERPAFDFADVTFTLASTADIPYIQQETNNFFDVSDLQNGKIFMLRSGEDLLGCGIAVQGRHFPGYASIGMVTCARFRKRGVGKFILWNLKEWCYAQGIEPMAGCWYYNTLSRKTLESVGLASLVRGMTAILQGREEIPERTGNPPGELVQ